MATDDKHKIATGEQAKQKIDELIQEIKVAQMVTCTHDHDMCARPMMAQKTETNGEIWFFTALDTRKVAEIQKQNKVLLSYAHPGKHDYVWLRGVADIVVDKAIIKALWSKDVETWFPNGPDDPRVGLIRFQAETGEYVDSTGNPLSYAYGYLKAKLAGQSPDELADLGKAQYGTR